MSSPTNLKNDYHIGIITALPIERAAITAMLDEEYRKPDDFDQSSHDSNSYTWGRMGQHNIVIASLAAGVYGNTMATTTAIPMLYSFTNIKFGLMVGIGAGIPTRDIQLGDVVVSQPSGMSGGVFQYDLGKAKHNEWERKDFLARPPDILLKALNKLQTEHEFRIPQAYEYLRTAISKHEYWGHSYSYPHADDHLFPSSYPHVDSVRDSCSACDLTKAIKRKARPPLMDFKIHYGVIASGNSLVKDAELRDWIASMDKQCVCIEMEAAGLMNNFPCLVIRGICDYADSHKNDVWQRYACATAAALSKELLSFVPLTDSKTATKATEVLQVPNPEFFSLPFHARNGSQPTEQYQPTSEFPYDESTKFDPPPSEIYPQDSVSFTAGMSLKENNARANSIPIPDTKETLVFTPYLFMTGERVNARFGTKNDTLLHSAVQEGDTEAVLWLIERGVKVNVQNSDGETPLYLAAQEGHLDIVQLLLDCKANVELADVESFTPLYVASRRGRQKILELLHRNKASIEAATGTGATPLYIAAKYGHVETVKYLLKNSANTNAKGLEGTALETARKHGYGDVVRILERHILTQKSQKSQETSGSSNSTGGFFKRKKKG